MNMSTEEPEKDNDEEEHEDWDACLYNRIPRPAIEEYAPQPISCALWRWNALLWSVPVL